MRHLQVDETTEREPAKLVMLLGRGIDRLPVPARDEERVHVEGWVTDRHRNGPRVVDMDAELLEALPSDGVLGQLARLDVSADEIPAVGVPPSRRVAVAQT